MEFLMEIDVLLKKRPIGEKYTCSCICAGKSIIKEANNIGLKVFFNENDLYEIRDEFLYESKKGKKYIDYYYKLSDHFQGNISISDVKKNYRYWKQSNSKIRLIE